MSEYRFVTTWRFDAPLERVWAELDQPMSWPSWWEKLTVEEVDVRPGDGIGNVRRFTLQAPFGYALSFLMRTTEHEHQRRIGGVASGDLDGSGLWELSRVEGGTEVVYTWTVRTTKRWMNLLAPLARPFFARNHAIAMRRAGEGLARHMGASLLSQKHEGG